MRTITTLLSIAAFSLHILLGCGWHLAHGADEVHGSLNHSHAHQRPCSGHSEQKSNDSLPESPEECSGPQCVYLPVGQTEVPAANAVPIIPVVVSHQIVGQATAIIGELFDSGLFTPHVRKHLALRHFLN